jgi:hypothetical protein
VAKLDPLSGVARSGTLGFIAKHGQKFTLGTTTGKFKLSFIFEQVTY